jgi:hypothetical protein
VRPGRLRSSARGLPSRSAQISRSACIRTPVRSFATAIRRRSRKPCSAPRIRVGADTSRCRSDSRPAAGSTSPCTIRPSVCWSQSKSSPSSVASSSSSDGQPRRRTRCLLGRGGPTSARSRCRDCSWFGTRERPGASRPTSAGSSAPPTPPTRSMPSTRSPAPGRGPGRRSCGRSATPHDRARTGSSHGGNPCPMPARASAKAAGRIDRIWTASPVLLHDRVGPWRARPILRPDAAIAAAMDVTNWPAGPESCLSARDVGTDRPTDEGTTWAGGARGEGGRREVAEAHRA